MRSRKDPSLLPSYHWIPSSAFPPIPENAEPSRLNFFPQELHDAIVDHLHANKRALLACSLVCRPWLYSSRYHLFSKVCLRPHNIQSFLVLLRSPCCTILPFVSHLGVQQSLNDFAYGRYDHWFNDGIPRLAELSYVRVLHLVGLRKNYSNALVALRENFNAVVDLEINQAVFHSISQFAAVINAFPLIERLVLEAITVQDKDHRPSRPADQSSCPSPSPLRHLRTLVCKSSYTPYTPEVLQWLLSHDDLPPISTLHLDLGSNVQPDDASLLNDFLRRLGPNLEEFHVGRRSELRSPPRTVHPTVNDLSHNTRLRSVHIQQQQLQQQPTGMDWILSLVSTIASPHLETVVLRTTLPPRPPHNNNAEDDRDDHRDGYDRLWDKLDAALARPRFAHLQRIEVCVLTSSLSSLSSDDDAAVLRVRARFPHCDARGVVIRVSRPLPDGALAPFADYLNPVVNPPPVVVAWTTRPGLKYASLVLLVAHAGFTVIRWLFVALFFSG